MKPLRYIVTIEPMDDNASRQLPLAKPAGPAPDAPFPDAQTVHLLRK